MPHRVADGLISSLGLIAAWGVQSWGSFSLLNAVPVSMYSDTILGIIPQWMIVWSWGLSTVLVFLGGLASIYLKVRRANAIRECRFPHCPYEDYHKERLCKDGGKGGID